MKTTNVKIFAILALSLSLADCGKTMVGTKVQKGGVGKVQPAENPILKQASIQQDTGNCLSLPNIVKQFGTKDNANVIAAINTWQLELGTGKRDAFRVIPTGEKNPQNENLRALVLLQRGNLDYINTTLGVLASGTNKDLSVVTDLLPDASKVTQTGCESLDFGNGQKADISNSVDATSMSFDDPTNPHVAKSYQVRPDGLLITTYTDLGTNLPKACGNSDPLVLKRTLYIQFGADVKDLQISTSLWNLLKRHVQNPLLVKKANDEKPSPTPAKNNISSVANAIGLPTVNGNQTAAPPIGGPVNPSQRRPPGGQVAPPVRPNQNANANQNTTPPVNKKVDSQKNISATSISPILFENVVDAIESGTAQLQNATCQ